MHYHYRYVGDALVVFYVLVLLCFVMLHFIAH